MVDQFDRLDERVTEIQALEKHGDEIDREINRRLEDAFVTPFDREDIHELISRLDDVLDGIQAIAETLVIYDVTEPTDECRRLAAIIAEQAVELLAALRGLDGLKGLEPHLQAIHDLEHEADGLSRAAVGRLFRDGGDPLERHQVARPLHRPRGHHRRGRGCRRGDRADEPQVELNGPGQRSPVSSRLDQAGSAAPPPSSSQRIA